MVANRLSADPRNRVLLLEAGPASHPWSIIPIGYARLLTNPAANWLYSSEPETTTNGRRIPVLLFRNSAGSVAARCLIHPGDTPILDGPSPEAVLALVAGVIDDLLLARSANTIRATSAPAPGDAKRFTRGAARAGALRPPLR